MLANILNRLSLRQKFAIMGILGLLLVSPPFALYLHNSNVVIAASIGELRGIDGGRVALRLLQQVQQHRGLSANFLGGENQLLEQRQAKQTEADQTMAALAALMREANADGKRRFAQVKSDWETLETQVASRSISVAQSYDLHTALCLSLLRVIEGIADDSGLSLDPGMDTYFLMRAVFFDAPALSESLGELRAYGAGMLTTRQVDLTSRAMLNGLIVKCAGANDQLGYTLGKATKAGDSLKNPLEAMTGDAQANARAAIDLAYDKIGTAEIPDSSAVDYLRFFTQSIDGQFKLADIAIGQLEALVGGRIDTLRQTRNTLTGVIVLIAVLSAVVGLLLARAILRKLGGEPEFAAEVVKKLATGDLSGRTALLAGADDSLLANIKQLTDYMERLAVRADAIGQGDFSQEVLLLSAHDRLGRAVNNMNTLLRSAKAEDERLNKLKDDTNERLLRQERALAEALVRAESASQAKSMFLANMSHEIRTPMNAVLGFAQLLERDPSLSAPARGKVATILKSGEHLLGIINDILEMSLIEAGRAEIRIESVDLHQLLDDLAVMFRQRAEEKGLALSVERADGLARYLAVDLGKLRQILVNLLGNAVKYTPRGAITMRVRPSGTGRIAIEVQDTGIGISPAEQEMLFRPFERTRSGKQTAGGTGLGLVISREYARLMGGVISVTSATGTGSCFCFELPAPPTAVMPVAPEMLCRVTGLAPGQEQIHVLVVDDEGINRELLRNILEPLGFIVAEVGTGQEAVAMASSTMPRVILMDLVMPGMDGIEATQILRRTFGKESLTIIGLSASAFGENKERFLESGIDTFLAKPFREQDLYDALARYAGVRFATGVVPGATPAMPATKVIPVLGKMPADWRAAFAQALALGSISRLRHLGEEAKAFDPDLSAFVLEQAGLYDLVPLKKLSDADA